jgi:hypothetical protein
MIPGHLPIAVRAYTTRGNTKSRQSANVGRFKRGSRSPRHVLVVDTETSIDAAQRLTFGSYRVLRVVRPRGSMPRASCAEEGIFYADDLPERDPLGFAILKGYAATHLADVAPGFPTALKVYPRREFIEKVWYKATYRLRATVVGFNLPFDHSRLACDSGSARGRFEGGFSLALSEYMNERGLWRENRYRPRIAIKTIDSKRALKGFTRPAAIDDVDRIPEGAADGRPDLGYAFRGHFLDLRTLLFALTDEAHSLESACEAFGLRGKAGSPQHGSITEDYIDYNRRDVQETAELFFKVMEEYNRHPIDLEATKAYSPASIGKAYLRAMGIQPVLQRQPDFPKEVLGAAMTAYYGGRAECRIRRVAVPVVYLDYRSMYPTVCSLMGLMRFLTCERVEVVDATEEVRALLSQLTIDECFDPRKWGQFVGLVQILPEGDIVPVRARYGGDPNWQMGVNPLRCTEPLWLTMPDAIAAKLLTRRLPRVLKAIRFVPRGVNPTLRSVPLRGAVLVNPRTQDFFKTIIEERGRVKGRGSFAEEERDRLEHFLKILASATSYGVFAEMVRRELSPGERETVRVYGLDGAFETKVSAPEEPGEFSFPPIAACISGAARLMLALLERLITEAGGTYAFCDTDGVAVVATEAGGHVPCPGGPHRLSDGQDRILAMSWAQVEEIRERFNALNPYDKAIIPSILKLEEENFDEAAGVRRQLWCYVISAKRYALYDLDEHGSPILRKVSEHGLGHLLNPAEPTNEDRMWIRMLWRGILTEDALGQSYPWPDWLNRPAIGRITVSTPSLLRLFDGMNKGRLYADRIKPFNFLLTTFVQAFGHPEGADPENFQLVAPWNPDPRQWLKMTWTDRYSGRRFRVTTTGQAGREGTARVKTYADVLAEYRVHSEPKGLGPDGLPCGRQTRGLLSRRPMTAAYITYIGKESNRLDDRVAGLIHDSEEVLNEYPDPRRDPFRTLVLPVLRDCPTAMIAERVKLDPTALRRIRAGRSVPRPAHQLELLAFAAAWARNTLRGRGVARPTDDLACCAAYLDARIRRAGRFCAICLRPIMQAARVSNQKGNRTSYKEAGFQTRAD